MGYSSRTETIKLDAARAPLERGQTSTKERKDKTKHQLQRWSKNDTLYLSKSSAILLRHELGIINHLCSSELYTQLNRRYILLSAGFVQTYERQ